MSIRAYWPSLLLWPTAFQLFDTPSKYWLLTLVIKNVACWVTVPAPITDAACNQKLFHSHGLRLIIKRGLKSKNIFFTCVICLCMTLYLKTPANLQESLGFTFHLGIKLSVSILSLILCLRVHNLWRYWFINQNQNCAHTLVRLMFKRGFN